jgi:hypothetical protein
MQEACVGLSKANNCSDGKVHELTTSLLWEDKVTILESVLFGVTDILKLVITLQHVGRCCTNVTGAFCCVFGHPCTNVIASHC